MKIDLHDTTKIPFYQRVSYLFIPALFVVASVLLEVMMFSMMGIDFPKSYIFSLSIVLVIAAVVAMVRIKWVQTVVCSLLLAVQVVATISNVIAYKTCKEIFSIETLKTLASAFGAAGAVKINYWFLLPILALIVIYVICVVLTMMYCKTPKTKRGHFWQTTLCGLLAFISFFSYTVAYSGLPNYKTGVEYYVDNLSNQKFLYDTFSNRMSSFQTFGSYSYYLDNLLKIAGCKKSIDDVVEFQPNTFALPEEETLGEGDNLIMVLMETFERAAINPITMPTLYKFMQESCTEVDGYYSIERTCFTDHIGQVGMHVSGKEQWSNYGDVQVPFSLANIFNRSSYVTSAFHDYDGSFYNRRKIFKESFGFQNFYDYHTYENIQQSSCFAANSDEELFKQNLEKIAPSDQNFYSYLISISTHSCSASENLRPYYSEYFDFIEKPENWALLTKMYPKLVSSSADQVAWSKNYLAGTCSFDAGFGALIDYLKNTTGKDGRKLIETTAIVMFGDHYSYATGGHVLKPENDAPGELIGNRSPLIVYNPKQKVDGVTQAENALLDTPAKHGQTLVRFASTMDLYPTVCSLFGVKTERPMTYGQSIFDTENQSLGISYLNGFTWGVTGYNGFTTETYNYQGVEFEMKKANWQAWRTDNFTSFRGVQLTQEQIEAVKPAVNKLNAAIFWVTSVFDKNGFKYIEIEDLYCLRKAEAQS